MPKEYKGHWQNIKWTCPKNEQEESKPYVTYQGRKMYLDEFSNWGNPHAPFTKQDGYTVYVLDIDEYGDRARVTYCPPLW